MKTIYLVTGNSSKVLVASQALAEFNIKVDQIDIDTPEIQAKTTEEVVRYSVKYAAEKTGKSVIKGDFGFYIESLNGFPGPYVKFVNSWLSAEKIALLYKNDKNKKAYVLNALGYCQPGKDPVTFVSRTNGKMLNKAIGDNGNPVDALFVPDGFSKTIASMDKEEYVRVWANDRFKQLAKYLQK